MLGISMGMPSQGWQLHFSKKAQNQDAILLYSEVLLEYDNNEMVESPRPLPASEATTHVGS